VLTKKAKYGLKALVHLASGDPERLAQAAEISEVIGAPKAFLDAILLELRNAGLIRSKKGPGGGFMLARPATEIRMGYVVRTLDGPIAPLPCARRKTAEPCQDCAVVEECEVRLLMLEVRDAIAAVLDQTTLAEMRDRADHDLSLDYSI
jgi:Rrf2 family protein